MLFFNCNNAIVCSSLSLKLSLTFSNSLCLPINISVLEPFSVACKSDKLANVLFTDVVILDILFEILSKVGFAWVSSNWVFNSSNPCAIPFSPCSTNVFDKSEIESINCLVVPVDFSKSCIKALTSAT